MKKFIVNKIMSYIKNNTEYDDIKLKEIEYGIVSIYITISKIIVVLLISLLLGIFKEVLIFMLFFNILRTTGFGLHATKSWMCWISSIIIFIGIPLICKYIFLHIYIKVVICIFGVIFMYKNAPADTKKKPIVNRKRRLILKLISTGFAILFSISAIVINNNFLSNCLIFALILENVMIAPTTYKIFKLPYNNYIQFLKEHPDFTN